MQKDVKKQYKKEVKRIFIWLLILLPFLAVITFCFSYFLNMSNGLNIFLLVIIGGFGVLLLEFIYRKVQEKKEKQPKKRDPYAD